MRGRAIVLAVTFLMGVTFAGCSALLALSQLTERTSVEPPAKGAARAEVERALGDPVAVQTREDGTTVAVYKKRVWATEAPAPAEFHRSPGYRAAFHSIVTVGTLGLFEVIATPIELWSKIYRSMNGGHYRLDVTYDREGRVVTAGGCPCP